MRSRRKDMRVRHVCWKAREMMAEASALVNRWLQLSCCVASATVNTKAKVEHTLLRNRQAKVEHTLLSKDKQRCSINCTAAELLCGICCCEAESKRAAHFTLQLNCCVASTAVRQAKVKNVLHWTYHTTAELPCSIHCCETSKGEECITLNISHYSWTPM